MTCWLIAGIGKKRTLRDIEISFNKESHIYDVAFFYNSFFLNKWLIFVSINR